MDRAASFDTSTSASDDALCDLLAYLASEGYQFVTPTPATHARVLARRQRQKMPGSPTLRDIFGWTVAFDLADVPPDVLALMKQARIMQPTGFGYKSTVRVSTLDDLFLLHSAYPTDADDAVFFGPDTYRFCNFIGRHARCDASARIVDVGCGGGAGGLVAAQCTGSAVPVTMNDINPLALRYMAVNARHAGIAVAPLPGENLAGARGEFDLIVSNPPYISDAEGRQYRHGGDDLGRALSVRIAREAVTRLAPGGTLLLYTGVAIVDGVDYLQAELETIMVSYDLEWSYEELDPDVFGEELEREVYVHADRIAVVGLKATKRAALR
jgi:SAM-dependent methyltransferase